MRGDERVPPDGGAGISDRVGSVQVDRAETLFFFVDRLGDI